MNRLLVLLICALALFSLTAGPVAHATEGPACVEASVTAHAADEDGDASDPGGSGKSIHHGGCHGHHFASLLGDSVAGDPIPLGMSQSIARTAILAGATPDPALRPPQA